ncbi:hypothetical protein Lal_00041645 [Lupinus albus]|nr:hypothetical protein Lal_00041645 [Lupinus albus]
MKFYIVANFIATRPQTFSQLLDMCGLLDLGRVVSKFSWFNRVDGGCNISKRLDTGSSEVERKLWMTSVNHLALRGDSWVFDSLSTLLSHEVLQLISDWVVPRLCTYEVGWLWQHHASGSFKTNYVTITLVITH